MILWWEMRTGKTRSALHAYNVLLNRGEVRDLVVVTVASAKMTWKKEAEAMGLGIPTSFLFGQSRKQAVPDLSQFPTHVPRIFILNWEILPNWQQFIRDLAKTGGFVLVLDELHLNCRNDSNKRYQAVLWLSVFAHAVWELTGTLQVRTGLDIHYQAKLLGRKHYPFHWMDGNDFGKRFCNRKFNPFIGRARDLRDRPGGWEYTYLKDPAELVAQMPALSVLRISDIAPEVPLPTQIPKWIEDLGQGWDFYRDDQTLAEEIRALIPLKARMTAEYVGSLVERPVVVFGWHVAFTEAVAELLEAPLIRGDTSVDEREAIRERFQAGHVPVLVGNLRSLGLGIALDAADHFVYGEPYWDASLYLQAQARGTNLAKRRSTTHHHLLVAGSVEEYVWERRLERGAAIERLHAAVEDVVVE